MASFITTTATTTSSDRNHLAPEDAYLARPSTDNLHANNLANASELSLRSSWASKESRRATRGRSGGRRKAPWKKLLWVKQPYPDNYTDEETFLDALQWNPRLRLYEFWPLVADSTVIVQQVCTMILFVCCFSGIAQERLSPVAVVAFGSICSVIGWVLWDTWVGREEALKAGDDDALDTSGSNEATGSIGGTTAFSKDSRSQSQSQGQGHGLGLHFSPTATPRRGHSRQSSSGSTRQPTTLEAQRGAIRRASANSVAALTPSTSSKSTASPTTAFSSPMMSTTSLIPATTRNEQRLVTAKSAILICGALIGLSPILKSLTKSTASDSIWAISFWLMCINVIFFDYGGGVGATFPASLSTNAALMASTVLASRLPSTAHVFSLTLFSIQVFGLFPVFRRYLRHVSWTGHLVLTWVLVMGAGAGVAMSLSGGGWPAAVLGVVLGSAFAGLAMGICSWWLIGLQRYKNEIHGPWDPARPVIRRWD